MLGLPGAVDDATHDRHLEVLDARIELLPVHHPKTQVMFDSFRQFLEEAAGGPTAAGTGTDLGGEAAKVQGLENLLGHTNFLGSAGSGQRSQTHTNGLSDSVVQQNAQSCRTGHDSATPHPRFRQPQMQRVITRPPQNSIDPDQLGRRGHLGAQNDAILGKAVFPGQLRGLQGTRDDGLLEHRGGAPGLGPGCVDLHEP